LGLLNTELTVVTCSKNDVFGLRKTLKSLLSFQSDLPKVILVLSDYSKAEIESIKTGFKRLKPQVFQIKAEGIYNAQNFGLQKVTTRLVMILNGGDLILSQTSTQKLVQKIGTNKWGYGSCELINPINGVVRIYRNYPYSKFLHRQGLKFVPHPSVLVDAKKAREFGGFDLKYKIAADQKMLLEFAKNSRPVTIPETIASFELGGASSRGSREITNDFMNISNEIFGYYLKSRVLDKIIWKIVLIIRKNLGR
jgi:Glycosyl transferase family 2